MTINSSILWSAVQMTFEFLGGFKIISRMFALALMACTVLICGCSQKSSPGQDFATNGVQGVRFDPSYYYNLKQPLELFVDSSVQAWQSHGINTLFFKTYDPEFGAVYKTKYPGNIKTDYGDKDLLGLFLKSAHSHGMRVIAWIPAFEHLGVWNAHPEWRMKASDGTDLLPFQARHFLCVRQPGFKKWWLGFIQDLMERYPSLDGVDFAEPAIVWKGNVTCACSVCRKEIDAGAGSEFSEAAMKERAKGMTDLLIASSKLVQDAKKTACVTFIATAAPSSDLLPFDKQIELTGLDLDRMLDSPHRPQWLSVELMWQQWADTYDNPATFRPDWTRKAVKQTLGFIGTRAHVIAHVEITPLGPVQVSPQELVESMVAARQAGAQSVEFYDTHLADSLNAWSVLEKAWQTGSERKALVLYDPAGLGVAKQVAVLFGHFGLASPLIPVDDFTDSLVKENDLVTYIGSQENHPLPAAFLDFAAKPGAKIFWADFNLWQLDRPVVNGRGDTNTYTDSTSKRGLAPSNGLLAKLGLKFQYTHRSGDYNTVLYGGQELFKTDSILNRVSVLDSSRVQVHARIRTKGGELIPYVVQSGNFWFIADCPTDYIVEGGRDLVFADLLHDFVGETHPEKKTALVRIEDVCPLSDPKAIRAISDQLFEDGIPFAIALVPYYVDPEENTAISLSDKPEFVKAIQYAISKGAAIVMHGTTHQYRGRSTHDYEFWDALHDAPIFEDSKEYVRIRMERGIEEMRKNGIYPIVYEMPHYAGSQLDYSIINQFYSTEYGRRQVIDKTGFDQIVPYFIGRHPSGNSIIPENLGYIPNDGQKAAPLLRFAKNNLVVRDGFASFFFHPWIDRKVLKELVVGIRELGFTFSDIRNIPLRMSSKGITNVTGNQEVTFNPEGKYLRTFYLDEKGNKHDEWFSDAPVSQNYSHNVHCPKRWSFVAEAMDKPAGWMPKFFLPRMGLLNKFKDKLFSSPPLKLAQGEPARPCLLWTRSSQESEAQHALGQSPAHSQSEPVHKPKSLEGFPNSQNTWLRAFQACGIDVDTLSIDQFFEIPEGNNLVVVPVETAGRLSTQQALILSQWVAKGKAIILEGPSLLAERMGIRATDSGHTVTKLKDDYLPQVEVTWPKASPYYFFDTDVEYVNEYSTMDDDPLIVGGEYGSGKYLFFATSFSGDPASSEPYRFPFFLDLVQREFNLYPAVKSPNLEVYYDPGNRQEVPLEELVINWRKNGVRAVYVASWHDYRKYTFEYGYLADLLHRNGMLAYAWFDLPEVSDRFWHEHPQWREKTAAGKDAEMTADIGWKQSMNLTNDTCRAGAFNALKRLLLLAPWDGAVLTGRMFSGNDPDSLHQITPFNASYRARYQAGKGYDPIRIFEPSSPYSVKKSQQYWQEFLLDRDSVEQALTAEVIEFLKQQRVLQQPGAEILLTRSLDGVSPRADSLYRYLMTSDPKIRIQAGITRQTLGSADLQRNIDAWSAAYPKWKPMVEIPLDRVKPSSSATSQLCGMELMDLIARAGVLGVRISLRTEDLIYDTDFKNLAYATAAGTRERFTGSTWKINAKGQTVMFLDGKLNPEVKMDGATWPAYDKGRLLIPEGEHRLDGCSRLLAWKTILQAPVRISGFNGHILEAKTTLQGIWLHYQSALPVSLALNQVPLVTTLDGLPFTNSLSQPMPKSEGNTKRGMALSVPAGNHVLNISTRAMSTSLMRQISIGLSGFIVVISCLTVLAFGLLYLGGAAKRLYSGESREK